MDGLSAAAAIVAVLETSKAIFEWTNTYINDVRHSTEDAIALKNELLLLRNVLRQLQTLGPGESLDSLKPILEACQAALVPVEQKLVIKKGKRRFVQTLLWPFNKPEIQAVLDQLRGWTPVFNLALSSDGARLLRELKTKIGGIESAVTGTRDNVAVLQSNQNLQQMHTEREKMLAWLLQVNYRMNHNRAQKKRGTGTGLWFLESRIFSKWLEGTNDTSRLLWLSGIAGTGKTVLMSTIINELKSTIGKELTGTDDHGSRCVIYFYFDSSEEGKRDPVVMLLCLLRQMVDLLDNFPPDVQRLRQETPIGSLPDIEDVQKCFIHICRSFKQVFVMIDALDESRPLRDTLTCIDELSESLPPSARILVTSRDELIIRETLAETGFFNLSIPRDKVDDDISTYVKERFAAPEMGRKFGRLSDSLQQEILSTFNLESSGMFLWASLQLDEISRQRNELEIRRALQSLPRNLPDTYKRIAQEIEDPKDKKIAKQVFAWLIAARHTLTADALCDALTIDLEHNCMVSPESRLLEPLELLEICRTFITIGDSGYVSLAHNSAKQYLCSPEAGEFYVDDAKIQKQIAAACIACLTFMDHGNISILRGQTTKLKRSFLVYCLQSVFIHIQRAAELDDEIALYLREIFSKKENREIFHDRLSIIYPKRRFEFTRISASKYEDRGSLRIILGPREPGAVNPLKRIPSLDLAFIKMGTLHLAWNSTIISHLLPYKCSHLISLLLDNGLDFLGLDDNNTSALVIASALNDERILDMMLDVMLKRNWLSNGPLGSALIFAIGARALETTEKILGLLFSETQFALRSSEGLLGSIVIVLSAIMGDSNLCQELIQKSGQIFEPGSVALEETLQIAFICASREGNLRVALDLLETGVVPRPDLTVSHLKTLWEAPYCEIFAAANAFWLGIRISHDYQNSKPGRIDTLSSSRNALEAALSNHKSGIVRLVAPYFNILSVIPSWGPRDIGWESWSSKRFDVLKDALRTFLKTKVVITEDDKKYLAQALLWCSESEETADLVETLVSLGINPNATNTTNDNTWTALSIAASRGHIRIVQSLLKSDEDGQGLSAETKIRALNKAIQATEFGVAQNDNALNIITLLLSSGIDLNFSLLDLQYPLVLACSRTNLKNRQDTIKHLLSHGANPNAQDKFGITPLIAACTQRDNLARLRVSSDHNLDIVRTLLSSGADPNIVGMECKFGTALIAACSVDNYGTVLELLKHGANPNTTACCGKYGTAAIAAAHASDSQVLNALISHGADPSKTWLPEKMVGDSRWESALISAAAAGRKENVNTLLRYNSNADINKVIESSAYGTPLFAASSMRRANIVSLLISRGADVDVELFSDSDEVITAPIFAACNGDAESLKALLPHSKYHLHKKFAKLWSISLITNIIRNRLPIIKQILSIGIDLNVDVSAAKQTKLSNFKWRKWGVPIIAAANKGTIDAFHLLASAGADVSVSNVGKFGDCLTAASAAGNLELVEHLLDKGCDANSMNFNRSNWSPSIAAIRKGHLDVLKCLVEHGAALDTCYQAPGLSWKNVPSGIIQKVLRSWHSRKRFEWDFENCCLATEGMELDHKVKIGIIYGNALIAAVLTDNSDLIEYLLDGKVDLGLHAKVGLYRTPLKAAIACNNLWLVKNLLSRGTSLASAASDPYLGSLTIAAAASHNLEMVDFIQKLLPKKEALHTIPNSYYGSPLIAACNNKFKDYLDDLDEDSISVVQNLLDQGCDPNQVVPGSFFGSAVIAAAADLRTDILETFQSYHININELVDEGAFGYPIIAALARHSLIHRTRNDNYTEEEEKKKFVHTLLEMGADVNVRFCGQTPLLVAVQNVQTFCDDIVTDLLDHGAQPDTIVPRDYLEFYAHDYVPPSHTRYTALTAAAELEKDDVVNIMLERGADRKYLPPGYKIQNTDEV